MISIDSVEWLERMLSAYRWSIVNTCRIQESTTEPSEGSWLCMEQCHPIDDRVKPAIAEYVRVDQLLGAEKHPKVDMPGTPPPSLSTVLVVSKPFSSVKHNTAVSEDLQLKVMTWMDIIIHDSQVATTTTTLLLLLYSIKHVKRNHWSIRPSIGSFALSFFCLVQIFFFLSFQTTSDSRWSWIQWSQALDLFFGSSRLVWWEDRPEHRESNQR